ncbi:MAG: hypothetical protein RIQ71_55 [Verrucomicrobiota bacterium]|jgi:hypothetical protein
MSETNQDFSALSASDVEIEAFGMPGTLGRWAAQPNDPPRLRVAHEAFWIPNPPRTHDLHVGFVADFGLPRGCEVRFRVIAPAAFRLMVDEHELAWGPLRFAVSMPEYQECRVQLPAGSHRISLHVIHEGLTTRLAAEMPGFAWIDVAGEFEAAPVWFGRHLHEYLSTGLRVSPLQGWMEWTKQPRAGAWKTENPARDQGWSRTVPVPGLDEILGPARESLLQLPVWPSITPNETARGKFRDIFTGYRFDDPAVAFITSNPSPDAAEGIDGIWLRFDLGRIRLGTIEFDVIADEAGEATVAYAEKLGPDGRPLPVVALSTGPTRFLQKFAFGPGTTQIRPLQSLGGRYLEIRMASPGNAEIANVRFRERDYLSEPAGHLNLNDERLDRIWKVGLETMRASTEDSAVDSVRERGEWTGDNALAGVELLFTGWNNLAPARRALYHAAASARKDGMVAGCGPGELIYLGTYAAQWVNSCVRCAEMEGSTQLLVDLEAPARRNVDALLACIEPDGRHHLPWGFIDWGYVPVKGEIEIPVLAHVVSAVDEWVRWQKLLGRTDTAPYAERADQLREIIRKAVAAKAPGYHAAVLAERIGAMDRDIAIEIALRQLRSSFPYNPDGKRLRDPTKASPEVATPYFTNYSVDLLLRAGKVDETLDIWRRAWGWMLDRGATTWWEVFDERWSNCHYWAGAPTWQMTRRILGVDPRLHEEGPAIRITVHPGALTHAEGRVAFPGAGWADVAWRREGNGISYKVSCPAEWRLLKDDTTVSRAAGTTELRLSEAGAAFVP